MTRAGHSLALAGLVLAPACSSDVCQKYDEVVRDVNGAKCNAGSPFGDPGVRDRCQAALRFCTSEDQYWLGDYLAHFNPAYPSSPSEPYACPWQHEELSAALADDTHCFGCFRNHVEAAQWQYLSNISPACQTSGFGLAFALINSGGSFGVAGCSWSGTYRVAPGATVYGGSDAGPPVGTETLAQTGATLTWQNFGSPFFNDCTLSLTLPSQVAPIVDLSGPRCGGTFGYANARLESFGLPCSVHVVANGADAMGNDFIELDYTMQQ